MYEFRFRVVPKVQNNNIPALIRQAIIWTIDG